MKIILTLLAAISFAATTQPASSAQPAHSSQPASAVKPADNLIWTDMSAYPLYGKIIDSTSSRYSRFPEDVIAKLPIRKAPESIQDLSRCSAGLYIRFRSDAKVLKARWEVEFFDLWPLGHMTDANKRGLDIYSLEDGKWVFMGVARPKDFRENTTALTVNPEGKMREYMLYLSSYDHVKWLQIGHPAGTTLEMPLAQTPKSDAPVLLYGTSITQGACSSRPGLGYANIMSRILDRTVINVGLSGNGCFDLPVAEYMTRTENPACIVIDNMANCNVKTVEDWAIPFIFILRKAYPNVPILLVSKPSPSTQYYNKKAYQWNQELNESFKKVFDTLKNQGDGNLYFLDLAATMDGCEYTVDGVHYTDPGMIQLAEGISKEVARIMDLESNAKVYASTIRKEVFDLLNLDYPGLEAVKSQVQARNWNKAAEELLKYYRGRPEIIIPGVDLHPTTITPSAKAIADDAMKHIFRIHGEPYWDYGKDINWEYWPVKDIEKRVFLQRVPMWPPMGSAYRVTGDEKYVSEWMYQLLDWERKNPYKPFFIDQHGTVSSGTIDVNSPNECFAWRPLDNARRLSRFCEMLALVRDAKCLTPEFITHFLCIADHNASVLMTNFSPAGNHLVHQASNILLAGVFLPELKHSEQWRSAAVKILVDQIELQTYPDGCHFEFDPGYQSGIVHSYNKALQMALKNGRGDIFPAEVKTRLQAVSRYFLNLTYPDGTRPCFSDHKRGKFYAPTFLDVVNYSPEPDQTLLWLASRGAEGEKPSYKTIGYPKTGFYVFRSGWDSTAVVMPVKATERGMWHAQPDFGTFELWSAGKVLMPDAGGYVYSGDEEMEWWRAYFKQTARHNALTLDDRDYDNPAPKVLKWDPDGAEQTLSVEHQAYEGLTHRRTVKFVDEQYFVITDEVRGDLRRSTQEGSNLRSSSQEGSNLRSSSKERGEAKGKLRLRFGFGEGKAELNGNELTYIDGNSGLKMQIKAPKGTEITLEEDWFSTRFYKKQLRPMVVATLDFKGGRQTFVTTIRPFTTAQ